jgi:hypothetical protein
MVPVDDVVDDEYIPQSPPYVPDPSPLHFHRNVGSSTSQLWPGDSVSIKNSLFVSMVTSRFDMTARPINLSRVFGVVLWPSVDPRKAWPDMSPECFTVKLRDSVLGDYGLVAAIKWEDLRLEPEFADTPTQQQGESDCTFRYRVERWATYAP